MSPAGSVLVESWVQSPREPVPVGVKGRSGPVGVPGRLEGVSGSSEPVSESFLVMVE